MKLSAGLNILNARDIRKKISKKITLANTSDRIIDKKAQLKAESSPSDPIFFTNGNSVQPFNPDIRYRTDFSYSPLTGINYRNDLLVFAENFEIKKAVRIMANEVVVTSTDLLKYPVYPNINKTLIPQDKMKVAEAIQDYLDSFFYPKLYQWYNFKDDGLLDTVKEFLITGKLAYEIIYDSLTNPKEIIGVQPIDPATLQKVKIDDQIYFIQRPLVTGGGLQMNGQNGVQERILHENQVVLVEWNKYDFGYISYVDSLRRPFNILRSMQTAKILWFAAKSQVRMHIKLALGDVTRPEAIQKLTESKNQYINKFEFTDDGIVRFNNSPNNNGYREFFTAETAQSGSPEIEEINANGPDLTETDSLNYWARLLWDASEIPRDRIDEANSDSWGFLDVNSIKKTELNFGKFVGSIRKMLNPMFMKPIIIQLTLKEAEIGVDLELLDMIKMQWQAFSAYEELAELETMNKRVELAQNINNIGELTDAAGNQRKPIPTMWVIKTFLKLTDEQLASMEKERRAENIMLGFNEDGSIPDEMMEDDEGMENDMMGDEGMEDDMMGDEGMCEQVSEDEEDLSLVGLIKSGQLRQEDIVALIDSGELTDEEIQELKDAGLYPEESPEDIQNADDAEY